MARANNSIEKSFVHFIEDGIFDVEFISHMCKAIFEKKK